MQINIEILSFRFITAAPNLLTIAGAAWVHQMTRLGLVAALILERELDFSTVGPNLTILNLHI